MATSIKKKPTFRRKKAREPMVDGDIQSAEAVTHTRIAIPQDDGTYVIKQVLESLDTPPSNPRADTSRRATPHLENDYNYDQMDFSPPDTPRPKKSRVSFIFISKK
jgi:hypothetical protein